MVSDSDKGHCEEGAEEADVAGGESSFVGVYEWCVLFRAIIIVIIMISNRVEWKGDLHDQQSSQCGCLVLVFERAYQPD